MGSKLLKTSGACPSAVHNCHGGRTSAEGLVVDGRILGLGVQLDGRLALGGKVSFMPPVCLLWPCAVKSVSCRPLFACHVENHEWNIPGSMKMTLRPMATAASSRSASASLRSTPRCLHGRDETHKIGPKFGKTSGL
jgi:hypothetical protein